MDPTTADSVFFDQDRVRDNALVAWTIADIKSRQGLGIRWSRSVTSKTIGRSGHWRMKGAVGAVIAIAAIDIVAAGYGYKLFPWFLLLVPTVSDAAHSLDGITSPWHRARQEGHHFFGAFSLMCRAQVQNLVAHTMINPFTPLLALSALADIASTFVLRVLAPKGKGPLARPLAAAAKHVSDLGLAIYEGPWSAGEARKEVRLNQALMLRTDNDIALVLYRRLAVAKMCHELLLDSWGQTLLSEQVQRLLTPEQYKIRYALKPMLVNTPSKPEDLTAILNLVDTSHTRAWWSPTDKTPPLAELAQKLRAWQKIKITGENPLDQRIAGLLAACESNLIDSNLTVAPPEALPSKPHRVRL